MTFKILTGSGEWSETNNYSVVAMLDTGDIEFLFTGDAEAPAEVLLTGDLKAEILKVGHHGSITSSSPEFLDRVKPKAAIISVGAGNSYDHPDSEIIERLRLEGATIYRTDLNGTIIVSTDGKKYLVESKK